MVSGRALTDLRDSPYQSAADMLDAMVGFLGKNPMTAYLTMMGVRLVELHRVLKPTGSLYLHCDPTASHYLKILLDAVFGAKNFRNEIIWQRSTGKSLMSKRLPNNHDILLVVQKSDDATWNESAIYIPYDEKDLPAKTAAKYSKRDPDGRRYQLDNLINPNSNRPNLTYEFLGVTRVWRWTKERMQRAYEDGRVVQPAPGRVPRFKRYLDEQDGLPLSDVWTDIPPLNSQAQERLGYPTQKPVALLERILAASSNEGDVVLDPFCGCGTTVHAAQKLNRNWIGIDITHLAIGLIETRLYDAFGEDAEFKVHGVPQDIAGAQDFFDRDDRTKKEFEKWAVRLIKAYSQSGGKKGADGGIDGIFRFGRDKEHKAIVSVKGGKNLGVAMIRDLDAVVTEQKAQIGIFLTLHRPTKPMVEWAKGAGTFEVEGFDPVSRLQIVTIDEALKDGPRTVNTPLRHGSPYKKAAKEQDVTAQGHLDI